MEPLTKRYIITVHKAVCSFVIVEWLSFLVEISPLKMKQ